MTLGLVLAGCEDPGNGRKTVTFTLAKSGEDGFTLTVDGADWYLEYLSGSGTQITPGSSQEDIAATVDHILAVADENVRVQEDVDSGASSPQSRLAVFNDTWLYTVSGKTITAAYNTSRNDDYFWHSNLRGTLKFKVYLTRAKAALKRPTAAVKKPFTLARPRRE
jgi:hypothetical protein